MENSEISIRLIELNVLDWFVWVEIIQQFQVSHKIFQQASKLNKLHLEHLR